MTAPGGVQANTAGACPRGRPVAATTTPAAHGGFSVRADSQRGSACRDVRRPQDGVMVSWTSGRCTKLCRRRKQLPPPSVSAGASAQGRVKGRSVTSIRVETARWARRVLRRDRHRAHPSPDPLAGRRASGSAEPEPVRPTARGVDCIEIIVDTGLQIFEARFDVVDPGGAVVALYHVDSI
jgi:hypothetical protein